MIESATYIVARKKDRFEVVFALNKGTVTVCRMVNRFRMQSWTVPLGQSFSASNQAEHWVDEYLNHITESRREDRIDENGNRDGDHNAAGSPGD